MSYNVLVVDDSKVARRMIHKSLNTANLPLNELYQAENGKEALVLLSEHWVDLMFTDINMPEMNGVELVEAMAEKDLLKLVPVIVVSSEGSNKRIDKLKDLGIHTFLRKPFTPEDILGTVNTALGA